MERKQALYWEETCSECRGRGYLLMGDTKNKLEQYHCKACQGRGVWLTKVTEKTDVET